MIPPVGKSGPGMYFIISASSISGLSNTAITPSITSPRLWVGMFVAIPTAMPEDPLTNKLGNLVGKTSGICSLPS